MRGRARSRLGRAGLLAMVIPLAPPPRGLATSQGPLLRTEALARYFGPRNSSESLVSRLNPPVLQAGKLGLRDVAALGLMENRTALLSRRTWVSDLNLGPVCFLWVPGIVWIGAAAGRQLSVEPQLLTFLQGPGPGGGVGALCSP